MIITLKAIKFIQMRCADAFSYGIRLWERCERPWIRTIGRMCGIIEYREKRAGHLWLQWFDFGLLTEVRNTDFGYKINWGTSQELFGIVVSFVIFVLLRKLVFCILHTKNIGLWENRAGVGYSKPKQFCNQNTIKSNNWYLGK